MAPYQDPRHVGRERFDPDRQAALPHRAAHVGTRKIVYGRQLLRAGRRLGHECKPGVGLLGPVGEASHTFGAGGRGAIDVRRIREIPILIMAQA
jgi:hypothetical protein